MDNRDINKTDKQAELIDTYKMLQALQTDWQSDTDSQTQADWQTDTSVTKYHSALVFQSYVHALLHGHEPFCLTVKFLFSANYQKRYFIF